MLHLPRIRLPRHEALLAVLLLPLLVLRHLSKFYQDSELAHFDHIVWSFAQMDRGVYWVPGPDLWETAIRLGGPLYFWIHLPARVFDDPVLGMHLYYGLLEALAILSFVALGLRAGVRRELVWASALCLVCFGDSKMAICENMTIASYLAIPAFMALLWALSRRPWMAMLLPGALLGMTIQVHLTALFFVPAVAVCLLLEPRLLLRRALPLLLGWALVVALSAPGFDVVGRGSVERTTAELLSRFDLWRWGKRLAFALRDPLFVLGLAVVLWGWLRREKPEGEGRLTRLAVLWCAAGYPLLAAALSYMSYTDDEARFALVNPGRAVLDGAALLWLMERAGDLHRRLARGGRPAPEPRALLPALALAASLGVGAITLQARAAFEEQFAGGTHRECYCDMFFHETDERYMRRYADLLQERGLPNLPAERFLISGPLKERVETLIHWMRRDERREARRRGLRGSAENIMLCPPLRRYDLSRLQGALDYGLFKMLPGSLPLKVEPVRKDQEYEVFLRALPPGRELLMVTVHGYNGNISPGSVRLLRGHGGGPPVAELDSCVCSSGTDRGAYAAWFLYRFPEGLGDGAVERLRVRLQDRTGELEDLWVVALPPERSR